MPDIAQQNVERRDDQHTRAQYAIKIRHIQHPQQQQAAGADRNQGQRQLARWPQAYVKRVQAIMSHPDFSERIMTAQWNEFLARQGAVTDNNRVLHFGNPEQEMQAVASGSIIADLSHLGLIALEGVDTVDFLQGQVTNDVKKLQGDSSQFAGYCNPKGRLLALFLAFTHQERLCLQLNGALLQQTMKRLKMYVLRSKVSIEDITDSTVRIGVAGPAAIATLQDMFPSLPQTPHQLVSHESATLLRLPGNIPRFELLTTPEQAEILWEKLQGACTPVGHACWEWTEIEAGIPDVTPSTLEAFVPQMLNLDLLDGINFKKGCYTGQEIVARTHYLGKVKRRTHLAHIDSAEAPQAGDELFNAETQGAVGQIVRAASAPSGGFDVLAELRLESVESSPVCWKNADGPQLVLRQLPYGW